MAKKIKTKLTVKELQTWIDGYCSAHEHDWAPTLEQWRMIKDKIFMLIESEKKAETLATLPIATPVTRIPPSNITHSTNHPRRSSFDTDASQNNLEPPAIP